MSVSGVSSSSGVSPTDLQSKFKQVKADFKALSDALNSGDVSSAQSAYAQLQKDLPQKAQSADSSTSGDTPMSALGKALQSGDLAGAQQAFATLQQARHGHHHHGGGAAAAPAVPPAASSDDDGTGSMLNVLA
jgi:hypothetical protein